MRRSSRSLAVAMVALSGAACAGRTPLVLTAADPGTVPSGPLEARLYSAVDQTVRFALNRPAYVAVFELVPGQGVSLIYPARFDDAATNPTPAGFNVAFLAPVDFGRSFYLSSYQGPAREPIYLYLVASDTPLGIGQILRDPGALRATLGTIAFSSSFGTKLMDLVDSTVVPDQPPDSWTSDYVALWPEDDTPRPNVPRVLLQCSDERLILLDPLADVNQTMIGCRAPRVVMDVPRDSTSRPDSAAGRPRRPPHPRADEEARPRDDHRRRHGDAGRTPLAIRDRFDADRGDRADRVPPDRPPTSQWPTDRAAPSRDETRRHEPPTTPRAEPRRADPPPAPPPPPAAKSASGQQ